MDKLKIKCCKCGNIIETLPKNCSLDLVLNEETGQMECYMGPKYGYRTLDCIICEKCQEKDC
ncbi:MAG: hypothetical protein ACFFEN_10230 [Candidatus Thorarchaeota archaeon]